MIQALSQQSVERAVRTGRTHHVTGILVAHNGQRWLPRTLSSLAQSARLPDELIAVDTGSSDDTAQLLADSALFEHVQTADVATGFGDAVREAVASADVKVDVTEPTIDLRDGAARPSPQSDQVEWLWLLHDDCAVEANTLQRLLEAADRHPDAGVIGPKVRGWGRPNVVVAAGMTATAAGRLETWVQPGEVDQGQYNDQLDVLAVGSAGMLVRKDVWARLGGFDPALPLFRDDLDFCWRARLAGERVILAVEAVVFHRQASYHGKRTTGPDHKGKRYQIRRAAVYTSMVHTPTWRLPFRAVRILVTAFFRVLVDLISLSPKRASKDLRANLSGAFAFKDLRRARSRNRELTTVDPKDLQWLRPSITERAIFWQESFASLAESGDEEHLSAMDRLQRSLSALAITIIPALVLCLAAIGGLLFSSGTLAGGALLPVQESAGALWQSFLAPWHEVGLGSAVPAPTYLALVSAVATALLGSATMAVQVLLLLAPVLAAVSALFALRGFATRGVGMAAALVYGFLPATIAAVGTGRLGTAVAAILLPMTVRCLVRATALVDRLPYRGWRSVALAGLATAALAAFSPSLAVLLVAMALVAGLLRRAWRACLRVSVVAGFVVALLWPWSGYMLSNPSLMLLEIGAVPPALAEITATPLTLLALDPGGVASPPLGWGIPLMIMAALALIPSRTRSTALMSWVTILAALIVGTYQLTNEVAVPSTSAMVAAWPGAMTLLMGAAALFAAAVAGSQLTGKRFFFSRVGITATTVAALMIGGWWVFAQQGMVTRDDVANRSAFVDAEALGSGAPRSMVISESGSDRQSQVTYQVFSGLGPQLGDAEVAPEAETMTAINQAVAGLTTGASDTALPTLAAASVQYIGVDIRKDRELARQLDAIPGLRRVSTVEDRGLWSVTDWVARVRSRDTGGVPTQIPVTTHTPGVGVVADLPAGATVIELAEAPSALLSATVADQPLASGQSTGTLQSFAVPAGAAGTLMIEADSGPRTQQLLLALGALGLALIMTLSDRGRMRRRHRSVNVSKKSGDSR